TQLVDDVESFLAVLGLNPNKAANGKDAAKARKRAIFFYNRKTRFDMERHWERKVKPCPFAPVLGGNANEPCAVNGDLNVRRWKALEFAATRRVEVDSTEGKGVTKKKRRFLHSLSADATGKLIAFLEKHHAASSPAAAPAWSEGKEIIEADICAACGEKAKPVAETKSEWNKSYFTQLKDLLTPTIANRKKRASLSATSANRLFNIASADGSDFITEKIVSRLREASFYDWRRNASVDFNPFPQVELLLGRRIKRGKLRGELAPSCQGVLRRIFADNREVLKGVTAPEYCVLEVIGDPPRNALQRAERDKEMKERRDKRDKAFEIHNLEDTGVASRRRRVSLWEQQGGKCPYTGKELPTPLDPSLEIEHIFPADMGGLSVDDNLVLTWRTVNDDKGKRTPLQFAGGSFDTLLAYTKDMRWNAHKREIFAWGTIREDTPDKKSHYNTDGSLRVPDFGNTTRTAQLARQLRAEIMRWMQVDDKPDEAARRIGTPSGWLAAQARKSWLPAEDYTKVRNNVTHHLIDAAVLAHIPPREGMNSVRCKGIFYDERVPVQNPVNGEISYRLLTKALPELSPLPRLQQWLPANGEYAVNPVLKRRRESKTQSLGDSTFWRQVRPTEATLAQRETIEKAIGGKNTPTGESLLSTLQQMGIPVKLIPSRSELQDWLDKSTATTKADKDKLVAPLKLTDGTPVKNLWKFDSKGSLSSPIGW
ncbi:MAG: HNH endonuclease domain-containing protein, partial [Verrucomicrobiota bacterium]